MKYKQDALERAVRAVEAGLISKGWQTNDTGRVGPELNLRPTRLNKRHHACETRVGVARDIGDFELPDSHLLKLLSKGSYDWLVWSQTSLPALFSDDAKAYRNHCAYWVLLNMQGKTKAVKNESQEDIDKKVVKLIFDLVDGERVGKDSPSKSALARSMGLDPSCFKSIRWARALKIIQDQFKSWENEVHLAFG